MNVRNICLARTVIAGIALVHPPLARAEPPRVFVLPVRSDAWLPRDDRLLGPRRALALGAGHRVRPIDAREIPAGARRLLPLDLAECTTPGCLRLLGQATG